MAEIAFAVRSAGGSGTPVVMADAQRATVTIALIPGGVITGTVRDARGSGRHV